MELAAKAALALLLTPLLARTAFPAESFRRGGTEFNALREVLAPSDKQHAVLVVQFFHHGQIAADGKNVVVSTQDQKLTPCRILQLGPGDYCRLAFQTVSGQRTYELLYGGEPPTSVPPWTNEDGLLLETRQYKDCNVNNFESVRSAFGAAAPYGSDYVDGVFHSYNLFGTSVGPFLSRYSGNLNVATGGNYGFFTSSRDCSFLLVDGKVVVEAPGVHGPRYDTAPGSRKEIQLAAGKHKFEYYHAATGPESITSAAWEVAPGDAAKAKASHIPAENFRCSAIGRAEAGPVTLHATKTVPDFVMGIAGDVPLPDNEVALVGVKFLDRSPRSLTLKGRYQWDFGDGQSSEDANPGHVYLHPGLYTISLTIRFSNKPYTMTNRVFVHRPTIFQPKKDEKLPTLDDYLPVLKTYNPRTLDAAGLRQLLLAYQWKIDTLLAAPEEDPSAAPPDDSAKPDPDAARKKAEEEAGKKAEAQKYYQLCVDAGKTPFVEKDAEAKGDEDLFLLASMAAPMARDHLGDSMLAGKIWSGAEAKIAKRELKAECQIETADVLLSDLVMAEAAKTHLDLAMKLLGERATGASASKLRRVLGDYYASTGKGVEARKAYAESEQLLASSRNATERTAWQGAHSRSTEQFLKNGDLDRAIAEIRTWEREFPTDKLDGYITLMYARYWAARAKYPQAIKLSDQLLNVNKDSPYVDQTLLVAAECELKRGEKDRALAVLNSILKDYRGSPLVPEIKEKVRKIESGEVDDPAKPVRKPRPPRGK